MRENQYIVVCSATSVESCLCLKAPRGFLRVKPLQ
nr:MAG TPA: Interleukin 7/9 family [Herelleviridae sp.]